MGPENQNTRIIAERVAVLETQLAGIEATLRRIEMKVDESIIDRATINATMTAIKADLNRAHKKIDGIYSKIWAMVTTSITALVATVWGFIKKG